MLKHESLIISYKKSRCALHPTLDARDLLRNHGWVYDLIESAYIKSVDLLALEDIDLYISLDDDWLVMPEFGFGGITYSKNSLGLSLSRARLNRSRYQIEFPALIAHELSHAYQQAHNPVLNWDNRTFEEDILSEGSAQVFQKIVYPKSSLYVNQEIVADEDVWLKKIRPLLHKTRNEFDRSGYMFGGEGTDKPRWIGYTLGYLICSRRTMPIQDLLLLQKI